MENAEGEEDNGGGGSELLLSKARWKRRGGRRTVCENTLSAASPRPGETTPRDHRACLRLSSPIYPRSNIEKRVGKYVSCYDRTNFLTVPAPLPAKLEQLPGTSRPRVPIDASSPSPDLSRFGEQPFGERIDDDGGED